MAAEISDRVREITDAIVERGVKLLQSNSD